MDSIVGLSKSNVIWVIIDRSTKSTNFLPIHKTDTLSRLVELYRQEIMRLHGISFSIISNRDPRFTSKF